MKTTETQARRFQPKSASSSYAAERGKEIAEGTHYQMRTEFHSDCQSIFALLKPWLLCWVEHSEDEDKDSYVDSDGRFWSNQNWRMDADIRFVTRPDAPSLNELRWLISTIVDHHVAAESLNYEPKYTGERMHYAHFAKVATQPCAKVIQESIATLDESRKRYENSIGIGKETIERLQAHLGNEEPYKRRVAAKQAKMLMENLPNLPPTMSQKSLERMLYDGMVFDKTGAHVMLET